ncbi:MAG TPA: hypothetical protein VFQ69_09540 [Rhizomicrobium sp.]|nr:hypothetical protein [Rhizomicrobium sp.]
MRLLKTGSALAALALFIQPAFAACIGKSDAAALKIAVMRQQLIVAALKCGEAGSYHLFADGFRDDLKIADTSVQDFFAARGGKAEYIAFRGKAAKLAWAEQAADAKGFCADARALLDDAKQYRSLSDFAQSRSGTIRDGSLCLPAPEKPAVAAKPLARPLANPVTNPVAMPVARPASARPPAIAVRTARVMPVDAPAVRAPAPLAARPVNPRVQQADLARADLSRAPVEPFRVTYYVPPLESYDVEEPRQTAQAEPARYQRRDWGERAYGPPPGWTNQWRMAWREPDARYDDRRAYDDAAYDAPYDAWYDSDNRWDW